MASTVTSRRKQLGNELRHARIGAKMTQQQVADVLGCTQGKVNKIESGAVGVKLGDVRAMLDAFGVHGDQNEHLMELDRRQRVYVHVLKFNARLAAVPNDFTIMRFPDRTRDFVYIEHSAGGIYLDDQKDFQLFVDAWDRLRGAALERQET